MAWIELHAKLSAKHATELGNQLTEFGAEAVTFQDAGDKPIYEPKPDIIELWPETIVTGLFDTDLELKPLVHYLEEQQKAGYIDSFHLKPLADRDWERVCLEQFKPVSFGTRLWICPSWHTPPDPNAINVSLDPGLAFGTGSHPTTAMCLEWLDTHIQQQEQVIDYGCGSGILSLAALKLGAKHVMAVDNDPQALEATELNSQRYDIPTHRLSTHFPNDPAILLTQADVLIANILAQPLIELAPLFAKLTHSGSKIVLSGILIEQIPAIEAVYAPWFTLDEPVKRNEWARLSGSRK